MSQQRLNQLAGNLPDELSPFVGRRAELAACKRAPAWSRLVTLTGPGGIGKTRLAIRIGLDVRRAVVDGVWLVELASLRDPALLAREVARSLGFSDRSTKWALATLLDHLRGRSSMLLLDNCEHLLDACAVLAETVLHSCPGVRMLATSREPLGVAGEVIVPVPTMSVPSMDDPATPQHLLRSEAARLFTSRAAGVRPDFAINAANAASVAELVRRLEGIPLAIELAAVRLRSLAPEQILNRLDDRFQLLSSGSRTAEASQKTMHATLEWSYALLSDAEQGMWPRCSVFADSFDLEAAEAVCSDDSIPSTAVFGLIDGLIAKSVLVCEADRVPARHRMLDTLREFGEAKRQAGHEAWLGRRHRDWYAGVAAHQGLGLEQVAWFERLHADHANLRAALEFCVAHRSEANIGLKMACDLWLYWGYRGHLTEGRRWADTLLAVAADDLPLRARGLWVAGYLGLIQGDLNFAVGVLAQARSLADGTDESAFAYASQFLGRGVWRLGDSPRGLALTEQALASHRRADSWQGVVLALVQLGWMQMLDGDPARSRRMLQECLELCDAHSERWIRSYAMWVVGVGAWLEGAVEEAAQLECEALTLKRAISDEPGSLLCIKALAWIAVSKGQMHRGAMLLGAAAGAWQSLPGFLPQPLQEEHVTCRDAVVQALGSRGHAAFASGARLGPDQATGMASTSSAKACAARRSNNRSRCPASSRGGNSRSPRYWRMECRTRTSAAPWWCPPAPPKRTSDTSWTSSASPPELRSPHGQQRTAPAKRSPDQTANHIRSRVRVLPDAHGRWSLDHQRVVKTQSAASPMSGADESANEASVSIFLAERDMGSTADVDIGQAHRALEAAARRVGSRDHRVRYLRTIYVPGEHRCICLFEASDAAIVRLVNDTAQLPFVRIAAAVEFASEPPALRAEQ